MWVHVRMHDNELWGNVLSGLEISVKQKLQGFYDKMPEALIDIRMYLER